MPIRPNLQNRRITWIIGMSAFFAFIGLSSVRADPLFEENWNSGTIDSSIWLIRHLNDVSTVGLYNVDGAGDYALMTGSDGQWGHGLYSKNTFSRGHNIRCTFKTWGLAAPENPQ